MMQLDDVEYTFTRASRYNVSYEHRVVVTCAADTQNGPAGSSFLLRIVPRADRDADTQRMPYYPGCRKKWQKLRHKSLLPLMQYHMVDSASIPSELKVFKTGLCHVELSPPAPTMLSKHLTDSCSEGSHEVALNVLQQLTLALLYLEEHGALQDSCCLGIDSVFVETPRCKISMCHGVQDIVDRGYSYDGCPEYLPPEVLLGATITPSRCTVWRLAAIVYECAVGLPPFYDENISSMYEKIVYSRLDTDANCVEKVPSELLDILRQMIKADPKERLTLQQLAPMVTALDVPGSDEDALLLNAFTVLCASCDATGQLLPSDIWSRFGGYFLYSERYNAVHHGFVGILSVG